MTSYNEMRNGQEFYGNGYKQGYDEGYKTGYADALLEVEELCQRKKKLFGADMRKGQKND